MHFSPGVVNNLPKAVGLKDYCTLYRKKSQIPIREENGITPGILVFSLKNNW